RSSCTLRSTARSSTFAPITAVTTFFCFQAEDGIRATLVTGVQTCALPIYGMAAESAPIVVGHPIDDPHTVATAIKIGRASCRERVQISQGRGSIKRKC